MSIGEYIAEMGAGEVENTGADSVLDGEVGVVLVSCSIVFFFFQAEDGIRDLTVTGVQTCALPILYPRGLFDFVTGVLRWTIRVNAYSQWLVTDRYPPFSLK